MTNQSKRQKAINEFSKLRQISEDGGLEKGLTDRELIDTFAATWFEHQGISNIPTQTKNRVPLELVSDLDNKQFFNLFSGMLQLTIS